MAKIVIEVDENVKRTLERHKKDYGSTISFTVRKAIDEYLEKERRKTLAPKKRRIVINNRDY